MRRLCPTFAHKKNTYEKTHVNWDEPKELNPLKSFTPKVKPRKKFKYFHTSLTHLPTYLPNPTHLPKYLFLIHVDQNPKMSHGILVLRHVSQSKTI